MSALTWKTLDDETRAANGPVHTYLTEIRSETLKMIRTPAFAVPTLLFPPIFYLFFAVGFGGSPERAKYLLATYSVFGVLGCALSGFGVGVAIERGQGWLTVKMASPMPVSAYFVAKIAMSISFGLIVFILTSAIAFTAGGVILTWDAWLQLALLVALGALPYCALGLALGTLTSSSAAPAVVNLVYLPMSVISGLWFPVAALPEWLQVVSPLFPAYHHARLALAVVGSGNATGVVSSAAWMAAFTGAFIVLAAAGWQRSKQRMWG